MVLGMRKQYCFSVVVTSASRSESTVGERADLIVVCPVCVFCIDVDRAT